MTRNIEAKVVLLGAASVGKTCIVTRATSDFYDPEQVPTVGASFSAKIITTDSARVTLRIWDTAGQERFRSLAPMYYQGSHAAIIVFSLTDPESLKDAYTWADELKEHFENLPFLYLVGNKSDLTDERKVTSDEANMAADKLNAIYFETSAKSGQNVSELFENIADYLEKKNEEPEPTVSPAPLTEVSEGKKSGCC